MYQHLPLQDPPQFYPNWDFWFENVPSGSPGEELGEKLGCSCKLVNTSNCFLLQNNVKMEEGLAQTLKRLFTNLIRCRRNTNKHKYKQT
jgi:hypothetical protein